MISASFNPMGLTSLQVCMDSSDWLQGTIHDETGGMLDSSSSSPSSAGGEMLNLTCSSSRGGVALISERRLRPPHDQALKCPRCDSTHTKFCYYNNYSLSQPRYFCKTCRRYWTKGGTLRNIPVGGGCRKSSNTKKGNSSKKSSSDQITPQNLGSSSSVVNNNINPTEHHLQLAFLNAAAAANHHDQMHFPHFTNRILGNPGNNFMLENINNPTLPIDFLGNGEMGSVLNGDMMINSTAGIINPGGGAGGGPMNFHNLCSPFGMYLDGNYNNSGANYMLTYETNQEDVKPNGKHLSLEWNDHQGCSSDQVGKQVDSVNFDYFNGVGSSSWTGLMNGYGTSATNPLV